MTSTLLAAREELHRAPPDELDTLVAWQAFAGEVNAYEEAEPLGLHPSVAAREVERLYERGALSEASTRDLRWALFCKQRQRRWDSEWGPVENAKLYVVAIVDELCARA